MLILTIAPGETICIGEDATIQLLTINENHVRVCIESADGAAIERRIDNELNKFVGKTN